jgi:hypothetical protein
MNKKTYQIVIALDDYGNEDYNANLFPFKEYNSYGSMEKITVLYAIKDLIQSEIDNLQLE